MPLPKWAIYFCASGPSSVLFLPLGDPSFSTFQQPLSFSQVPNPLICELVHPLQPHKTDNSSLQKPPRFGRWENLAIFQLSSSLLWKSPQNRSWLSQKLVRCICSIHASYVNEHFALETKTDLPDEGFTVPQHQDQEKWRGKICSLHYQGEGALWTLPQGSSHPYIPCFQFSRY